MKLALIQRTVELAGYFHESKTDRFGNVLKISG